MTREHQLLCFWRGWPFESKPFQVGRRVALCHAVSVAVSHVHTRAPHTASGCDTRICFTIKDILPARNGLNKNSIEFVPMWKYMEKKLTAEPWSLVVTKIMMCARGCGCYAGLPPKASSGQLGVTRNLRSKIEHIRTPTYQLYPILSFSTVIFEAAEAAEAEIEAIMREEDPWLQSRCTRSIPLSILIWCIGSYCISVFEHVWVART